MIARKLPKVSLAARGSLILLTGLILSGCRTERPAVISFFDQRPLPDSIGFHKARFDAKGKLLPWVSLDKAMAMEMEWYAKCPVGKKGYPVYYYSTFMHGNYEPYNTEIIPCTQLGMGIISYLKYYAYTKKADQRWLEKAQLMGKFLAEESLAPDNNLYSLCPCSISLSNSRRINTISELRSPQ